jgi:hypothetical protein
MIRTPGSTDLMAAPIPEMSPPRRWPQTWKACWVQALAGSNPAFFGSVLSGHPGGSLVAVVLILSMVGRIDLHTVPKEQPTWFPTFLWMESSTHWYRLVVRDGVGA